MQDYCVNTIGASCAMVVVFPAASESGNPGNCGNACSCENSVRGHFSFWSILPRKGVKEGNEGAEKKERRRRARRRNYADDMNKQKCPAVPPSCVDSSCFGTDGICMVGGLVQLPSHLFPFPFTLTHYPTNVTPILICLRIVWLQLLRKQPVPRLCILARGC